MASASTRRTLSATRWARRPRCMSASTIPSAVFRSSRPAAAMAPVLIQSGRDERARSRETGKMFAAEDDGGRCRALRRRPDAPGAQEQRPARLCRIHQDAGRTFVQGPCADDGESAGQAADAVGHGSGPEKISRRRSWCWSATRTSGASTPACSCGASCRRRGSGHPALRPHHHQRGAGRRSMPRSPNCSPRPKPAAGWRINHTNALGNGRMRWTSNLTARRRW